MNLDTALKVVIPVAAFSALPQTWSSPIALIATIAATAYGVAGKIDM